MKLAARPWRIAPIISLAAACARSSATSAAPSEPSRAEVLLDLEAADAEVWSWDLLVSGKSTGRAALERCSVSVDGNSHPAEIEGERFSARVHLAPGASSVAARCSTDHGELRSAAVIYNVRLTDRPKAIARAIVDGDEVLLDGTASRRGEYARAPLARWQWTERADLVRTSERAIGDGSAVVIAAPADAGEHHYRLRVTDVQGQTDDAGAVITVTRGKPANRDDRAPALLEDAIVYGVVPPLHGTPPLRAAAGALDGIAALGATVVWLSPLFGTLPGDFGYAVTDYEHLRSDYGTRDDLRAFVAAAHERNLRVILDFVPNHTAKEHPYFRQAETLGIRSHYFPFYERDEQGQALHYFDWEHLPNLRYQNDEVERWMTEIAAEWIRAFGVDGYRVDAAWGVARRRPDFWRRWSEELRRMEPQLLLVAEASARESYYASHGFDVAYDWTDEVGQWAWKDVFIAKDARNNVAAASESATAGIVGRLHQALTGTAGAQPRPDRVLRFLNNNDTGPRFITRHGENMTRVATAALFTLPGVPCLYDFDEVGGEFEPYADLLPLRPKPRPALRDWHEKLIRLRRTTPALRGRGFAPLLVDDQREVYAFFRGADGEEPVLVVLHFADRPTSVNLALPAGLARRDATVRDLLTGRSFAARDAKIGLTLPGWDALILAMPRGGKSLPAAFERATRNSRSPASTDRVAPSR